MIGHVHISALALGLLAAGLAAAEPPPQISATEWARIRDLSLATISRSDNADEVTVAYNVAASIDPNYPAIHKAYMDKMLQMGLVHVAYPPAVKLTVLQPACTAAWSTVTYMRAKKDDLAGALAAAVHAAALDANDVGLANNLGQLEAWLAADPNARPDDNTRRDADELAKKFRRDKAYQAGYERAKKVYDETNEANRTYKRRIGDAQNAVDNAQAELDRLIKKNASAKQQSDAHDVLQRKKDELSKVRIEFKKALQDAQRHWRWDPPCLNGQPVQVVESLPDSKLIAGVGEEERAATKLRIAQLFLDNKKPVEASVVLKEIIANYGATQAAAKAKALLDQLPK